MKIDLIDFQKAWNDVGIAVYKLLQVINVENHEDIPIKQNIDNLGKIYETTNISKTKEIVKRKYAVVPYLVNGQYFFKRLVDEPSGRYYEIKIYDDGLCSFKLCCDVSNSELLQNLKDSQDSILPSEVAIVEGIITSNMSIEIKKEGEAEYEGNDIIKILRPMEVVFKS